MKHYTIPIFLPFLACPGRCVFCDQHVITQQEQVLPPEGVAAEVSACLATLPAGAAAEVAFFGGNFTALPLSRQLCYAQAVHPFIAQGRVRGIRISTRPDCIFPEQLDTLRAAGVTVIELGVQSFTDEALRQSARGYDAATAEQACRRVREAGFSLGVQLMPGLPGDDRDACLASTRVAVALQPDMIRIYPTVVLAGTELAQSWLRKVYRPLTLAEAIDWVREMFLLFTAAGIAVIRMGLQSGENLDRGGKVLAGPYHPAFGELVEQSVFLEQALVLAADASAESQVWFFVHPRDQSKLIGYKRQNVLELRRLLRRDVRVIANADIERDSLGLSWAQPFYPDTRLTRAAMLERRMTRSQ
jgi:histone acetyltransferase (RNA polymerase elongator complex component)